MDSGSRSVGTKSKWVISFKCRIKNISLPICFFSPRGKCELLMNDVRWVRSSEVNSICYVETSNLDGETNLKVRQVCSGTLCMLSPRCFRLCLESPSDSQHQVDRTAVCFARTDGMWSTQPRSLRIRRYFEHHEYTLPDSCQYQSSASTWFEIEKYQVDQCFSGLYRSRHQADDGEQDAWREETMLRWIFLFRIRRMFPLSRPTWRNKPIDRWISPDAVHRCSTYLIDSILTSDTHSSVHLQYDRWRTVERSKQGQTLVSRP